ncbi:hypothetical protein [Legionella pneumophila]|uniref:Uncharacterized protein n=1 Tax=Legionella pneumophila subsp. pascullei TaxID=91890 RepID=A0AAX2J0E6_LEGPN|nr:hypothetical protein [Legionella pneumophila]AMP90755.1 hypothetical protein AXF35_14080 [Legionella pneumophila subsp. pascullei]AMP93739.1 hypothetical protein AXF36_14445 [Legionella pneumophila subsp. pascullei]AMP96656.1 hypothetical protein AXF37_14080 [Legionella pneumophila subsp. pascullei]SQG91701.1 Uncharacterised protein [Legionella pneumophila subsp. pascullei]VEH08247.1 Uncharacterised protein [Legionella pneumophila subsp. pascullei]
MKQLILHPTDISQWHALVNEAQAATRLILNENTESYLVFLLMRFSQGTKLIESVVALDFLESMRKPRQLQVELLRDVGDKSLLFCGLFPGIAKKRHVSLSYFSDMGQAAYLTVGELEENQTANLYFQLSEQFITLQQVLQAMRGEYIQFSQSNCGVLANPDLTMQ